MVESNFSVSAEKLKAAIVKAPHKSFAVIDGAQFDDLSASLKRARLFARSLFLDQVDEEIVNAGPWLVSLAQSPEATDRVFHLVSPKPAAVFWICDLGESVLYRHLRTLNVARIPNWAADGAERPPTNFVEGTYKTVFFRHFDPSVIGALMPVLDAAQFARILGPADEIAFDAVDFGGVRRVVATSDFPQAPPGPLTINSRQIESLSRRRLEASHHRNVGYLREVAGQYLGGVPDEAIYRHVLVSYSTGRQLGLESEGAHARWSLLMVLTKGRILQHQPSLDFIKQGRGTADDRTEDLITITIDAMRETRRNGGTLF